jgi:hypothetical protein
MTEPKQTKQSERKPRRRTCLAEHNSEYGRHETERTGAEREPKYEPERECAGHPVFQFSNRGVRDVR